LIASLYDTGYKRLNFMTIKTSFPQGSHLKTGSAHGEDVF